MRERGKSVRQLRYNFESDAGTADSEVHVCIFADTIMRLWRNAFDAARGSEEQYWREGLKSTDGLRSGLRRSRRSLPEAVANTILKFQLKRPLNSDETIKRRI